MCGRFVQKTPLGEIRVLFEAANPAPNAPPRYNAAPTDSLAVVRFNPQTRARSLDLLRWGLVPLWAKDPSFGPKCINARSETVATNKIFREAFERRRCLIPADAFYEWRKIGGGKPVPYAVAPREGMFAFAGLWDRWRDASGKTVETCSILTTTPNALALAVHDRVPVILDGCVKKAELVIESKPADGFLKGRCSACPTVRFNLTGNTLSQKERLRKLSDIDFQQVHMDKN